MGNEVGLCRGADACGDRGPVRGKRAAGVEPSHRTGATQRPERGKSAAAGRDGPGGRLFHETVKARDRLAGRQLKDVFKGLDDWGPFHRLPGVRRQ